MREDDDAARGKRVVSVAIASSCKFCSPASSETSASASAGRGVPSRSAALNARCTTLIAVHSRPTSSVSVNVPSFNPADWERSVVTSSATTSESLPCDASATVVVVAGAAEEDEAAEVEDEDKGSPRSLRV